MGDINGDGFIDVLDIVLVVNLVLASDYEINGETDRYFQKFKKNSCFSYEKKIKMYLNSISL